MKRQILPVCGAIVVALSTTFSHAAELGGAIIGKDWRALSSVAKVYYLAGLLDGDRDARLDIVARLDGDSGVAKWAFDDRYGIGPLTVGDRMKALDSFYSDYKNIYIEVPAALRVIGMQIMGLPEDQIQKTAAEIRAASAPAK
jgi:hypothetical protein